MLIKKLVLCICLFVGGAAAVHIELPAQPRAIAIRTGKILDVKTGTYLLQQMIWIEGERIKQIGPVNSLSKQLPVGTQTIDLSDATVLPGLIDVHTHLTVSPESVAGPAGAGHQSPAASTSNLSVWQPTELAKRNARITLQSGFTTVRDVGAHAYEDVALRDAINAGDVPGPRMLVAGKAQTGRAAENVSEARSAVLDNISRGADLIKLFATGGVLLGNDITAEVYSFQEMRAMIETAHSMGRKIAAHAHGAAGIKDAVLAGVDSIEHGSEINAEIIELMKQRGTYLVPTVYVGQWFQENASSLGLSQSTTRNTIPGRRENLARAFREGVKVALGTDSGTFPNGLNIHEFSAMAALGMTPLQVLQAGTVNAADLLGWADRVGTLEAGKFADLIGIDGDPVSDLHALEHVRFVMKGGILVKSPDH
jgi:imidazolonepropionase-like amidohydrolase